MNLKTRVCEILEIEYPIVLAGMGGARCPELAAAVSNAGGRLRRAGNRDDQGGAAGQGRFRRAGQPGGSAARALNRDPDSRSRRTTGSCRGWCHDFLQL
jgi:NAD(P)H-dependent flavin oxidoreductase YrpB (nitropropane dioxygenase family)